MIYDSHFPWRDSVSISPFFENSSMRDDLPIVPAITAGPSGRFSDVWICGLEPVRRSTSSASSPAAIVTTRASQVSMHIVAADPSAARVKPPLYSSYLISGKDSSSCPLCTQPENSSMTAVDKVLIFIVIYMKIHGSCRSRGFEKLITNCCSQG